HSYFVEADGSLIRLEQGQLSRLKPGKSWTAINLSKTNDAAPIVLMAPTHDGLWLHSNGMLRLFDGKEVIRTFRVPTDMAFTTLVEDGTGSIWLPSWGGKLVRLDLRDGSTSEITPSPGTGHNAIRSLITDREGNVWFGMHSFGLMQVRPKTMRTYGMEDGLLEDVIRSVNEDLEGNLWIVSTRGLNLLKSGRLESSTTIQNPSFWSATPAGPGRMW